MAKPFTPENFPYTLIHDDLAPVIANQLGGSAVKLLYYVMRKSRTDFTHFRAVRLPYAAILVESGIKSRATISSALNELIDADLLIAHQVGSVPGFDHPLYEYTLNLDYSTENGLFSSKSVPVSSKSVLLPSTENELSSSKSVLLPSTENELSSSKSVLLPTMQSADPLQAASNSIEQGALRQEDHDHERDLPMDKEDLLTRFVSVIGLKNSLAYQLIGRMGMEKAWLWYGFVLDSRNRIESAASYLYTCCIAKQSEPPISYTRDEIDALERRYVQQNLAADAVELAEVIHTVAGDPPDPGQQDNGLAGLWKRTLHELQEQMTVSAFNQWLAQTELLSIQEGRAIVKAHNGYAKEWLSTRLKPPVLRTLAAIAGNAGHVVQDVIFETEEP